MSLAPVYKVPAGTLLVLGGHEWKVIGKDKNGYAVESTEDGDVTTFNKDWLQGRIADLSCEVLSPKDKTQKDQIRDYTGGFEFLEQLSKDDREIVRARHCLVMAIDKLKEEGYKVTQRFLDRKDILERLTAMALEIAGDDELFNRVPLKISKPRYQVPKGRTLHEWWRRYHDFGRNEIVLMNRNHRKGPQGEARCKLCELQQRFIKYVIEHFRKLVNPTLFGVFTDAKTVFEVSEEDRAAGFKFPSITTTRKWLAREDFHTLQVGRKGEKHATNEHQAGLTDTRAITYGQAIETDQAYLSIFIRDDGLLGMKEINRKTAGEELEKREVRRI